MRVRSNTLDFNTRLLTVIDETISKLDPAQEAENNRGDQENIGKDRHHGKKRPFAEHEAIKSARKHDTLDGHQYGAENRESDEQGTLFATDRNPSQNEPRNLKLDDVGQQRRIDMRTSGLTMAVATKAI